MKFVASTGRRGRARAGGRSGKTLSSSQKRFVAAGAAVLALGTYAGTVMVASATTAPGGTQIVAAGPVSARTGYLGSSSYSADVSGQEAGDLEVVAIINDSWPHAVSSVTGGGVDDWSSAGSPFFDGADGQVLQIWYGTVATAGTATLTVSWDGPVHNADVANQEFSAGAGYSQWSLAAAGSSARPFPALAAPGGPALYFGAAMAWGGAGAGTTPGVSYTVPSGSFLTASGVTASGVLAPTASGAGSVGALFTVAGSAPAGAVTTTTVAATSTSAATSSTSTTGPSTTTSAPTTSSPPAPAPTSTSLPATTSTSPPPAGKAAPGGTQI
ncbi:MAG: hypothetical protein ACRDZX_01720, partial [Acidimicrobiales bacterium]